MTNRITIVSYFSLPTDLASEMRDWKEFVAGEGYSVDLKNTDTGETVSVRYVEKTEGFDYVQIDSNFAGELFDRVVGRTIRALSMHSDNLMVSK